MKKIILIHFLFIFVCCFGNEITTLKNNENIIKSEKESSHGFEELSGKWEGFFYNNDKTVKMELLIKDNKVEISHLSTICELIYEEVDKPYGKVGDWYSYFKNNNYIFSKRKKKDFLLYGKNYDELRIDIKGYLKIVEGKILLKIDNVFNTQIKEIINLQNMLKVRINNGINSLQIIINEENYFSFDRIE